MKRGSWLGWLTFAGLLASAGCAQILGIAESKPCQVDAECPNGLVCRAGTCAPLASGPGAAGAGAGAAGGAGTAGGSGSAGSGAAGGSGSGSAGTAGSAGGSSPECALPSDCEGADSDCAQRTCNSGKCGIDYAKDGTAVSAQTPGDCQKAVCDGSGRVVNRADDSDVTSDSNVCLLHGCSGGTPTQTPAPNTTSCGSSSQFKCDGAGTCGGCTKDADCGTNNLCATYKCMNGTCMNSFVPNGQGSLANQAGDCQKNVCNGMGSPIAIADDSDVPVDGKVCTKDMCSAGVPSNPPLGNTTSCGTLSKCDGSGNCVCSDPNACAGIACGVVTDGCGRQVTCPNTCSGVNTCGGAGDPHACGCTPTHALNCGQQCGGAISDNCGNTLDCGNNNCQYVCQDNCSTKACLSNFCYCADCNG